MRAAQANDNMPEVRAWRDLQAQLSAEGATRPTIKAAREIWNAYVESLILDELTRRLAALGGQYGDDREQMRAAASGILDEIRRKFAPMFAIDDGDP